MKRKFVFLTAIVTFLAINTSYAIAGEDPDAGGARTAGRVRGFFSNAVSGIKSKIGRSRRVTSMSSQEQRSEVAPNTPGNPSSLGNSTAPSTLNPAPFSQMGGDPNSSAAGSSVANNSPSTGDSPTFITMAASTSESQKTDDASLKVTIDTTTVTQTNQDIEAIQVQKGEAESSTAQDGRTTQNITQQNTESTAVTMEAGETVWMEHMEEKIDLEAIVTATGRLMRIAHFGKHIIEKFEIAASHALKVLNHGKLGKIMGLHNDINKMESFEERMGREIVRRMLGKGGPNKSLLAILGPQGIAEATRFVVGRIPIPGIHRAADISAHVVEGTFDALTNLKVFYSGPFSFMQAALLSHSVSQEFHRVYGKILNSLTPEEQNDLIRYAVETAMFCIDRHLLEHPRELLSSQKIVRSLGTEFLDLDSRLPRAGMLWRRAKMAFFNTSGLKAYEARALLTSTPVHIDDYPVLFSPVSDPKDPRSLLVKAFWRGKFYQDAPVSLPERFKSLYREGNTEYAGTLGIVVPSFILPAPIAGSALSLSGTAEVN